MKKYIKDDTLEVSLDSLTKGLSKYNIIYITMYLHPIIYVDSQEITGSISWKKNDRRYHTDVNPSRVINGPLSGYGEELESPIKEEYQSFVDDCVDLVNTLGFRIISRYTSTDSKKSEYLILFGMDDDPCGLIVYDFRISDHPFDAEFPEELKDKALEYLKMEKILDGSATKAGIDFQIEKVTVGSVKNDTWDRALNRAFQRLKRMKNSIKRKQKSMSD